MPFVPRRPTAVLAVTGGGGAKVGTGKKERGGSIFFCHSARCAPCQKKIKPSENSPITQILKAYSSTNFSLFEILQRIVCAPGSDLDCLRAEF